MCWPACTRFARVLAAEGGWPAGIDFSRVVVEPPRDAAHGDMATNAAMVLAKEAKAQTARSRRKDRRADLRNDDLIAAVDIAGPGFINLTLKPLGLVGRAAHRAARGRGLWAKPGRLPRRHGQCRIRLGQPDRPDACRPLPRCGVRRRAGEPAGVSPVTAVTREYYINDAGAQVDVLARSAFLRYREALGENIGEIPEGLYPGDYLKPVGAGAGRPSMATKLLALPEADVVAGRCATKPVDDDDGG